jgi:hypothetical protein
MGREVFLTRERGSNAFAFAGGLPLGNLGLVANVQPERIDRTNV